MATDDPPLTVDDLVTGRAGEELGEGVIPTTAVLIVATMSADSPSGLRYVIPDGTPSYVAIGMLRSVLIALEASDLQAWDDGE